VNSCAPAADRSARVPALSPFVGPVDNSLEVEPLRAGVSTHRGRLNVPPLAARVSGEMRLVFLTDRLPPATNRGDRLLRTAVAAGARRA